MAVIMNWGSIFRLNFATPSDDPLAVATSRSLEPFGCSATCGLLACAASIATPVERVMAMVTPMVVGTARRFDGLRTLTRILKTPSRDGPEPLTLERDPPHCKY
ncbi:hypothetical protein GCM10010468_12700 [Actinocorallia longicatena]|uniref:Uncharacterized protein n=1 Tax=Actinocorallia longicatena TaxID=111803 RepID=A0ABP6Q6X4_9ACTN